jgi:acyl carrier protein
LCIGGIGLAIGYINQPEVTAEKFAPHPFGRRGGDRLYRTGDMARYLADGKLELAGRVDHQVKVRGHRIELGEIESLMMASGLVKEAVVVMREEEEGEKRLAAYAVRKEGIKEVELQKVMREYLRERVPGYMMPAAIVELTEMPLTSNGKVNRRALPQPEYKRFDLDGDFVSPRNKIEETICALWREVLKIDQISIYDNFFDLGGHSLLLTQVYAKLRDLFARELTMLDMFKYASISSLAEYLSEDGIEELPPVQFQDRAKKQKEARRQQKKRARAVNPVFSNDD